MKGVNSGAAVTVDELRHAFVAKSPEVFEHDTDGNLTADARWTYIWDGENRLIEMVGRVIPNAPPPQKLQFIYDGQGRRISKQVSNWNGTAWLPVSVTRYVYDGWNLLAELRLNPSTSTYDLISRYVWGLDLSGTAQGAGGVGGLLFANLQLQSSTSTHAPAWDGNGNVTGLVDMSTGAKSATYEYNAFGETLIADGVAVEAMPFRFSTKYQDSETGFYNYGYRIYQPSTGRWLSKDPIEEDGGHNLYGMIGNDPVNGVDYLGLFISIIHRELTRASLDRATINVHDGCKDRMYRIIADANVGQDSGGAFDALERHYNRPFLADETEKLAMGQRRKWDEKYREYISSEQQLFDTQVQNKSQCEAALRTLGRLSHSWQDFYAHAYSLLLNPATHERLRFAVWANGLGDSPDAHAGLWPSSYNEPFSRKQGEHPNLSEPATGAEALARRNAAIDFVAGKYAALLSKWSSTCACWCEQ